MRVLPDEVQLVSRLSWKFSILLLFISIAPEQGRAQQESRPDQHTGAACWINDNDFADSVWAKVGERVCLKCHQANGEAEDSDFLLRKPGQDSARRLASIQQNQQAFKTFAKQKQNGRSVLLQKVVGELDHGGGQVLKSDSTEYKILDRFAKKTDRQQGNANPASTKSNPNRSRNAPPFFEGVEMISTSRLLRRVSLSLAGRLPTAEEKQSIKQQGAKAVDAILNQIMKEDAFYDRLKEGFNDILLTYGYDDGGESALSYTHFHKTRLWYQQRDPNKGRSKEERLKYSHPKMRAYYQLVKDYREALRREPGELIAHIVNKELPFSEIVTADYIMVSPYTARGYGIFDELKDQFKNPEDPFEFIPTRLRPLTNDSNGRTVQESKTGFYPHAGVLSTFQYLKRYPTTETNRNRLRVRMYFEHFLGVDILQLAPRVSDAATVTSTFKTPTMEAPDCVVCHKVIDPIAGLFQDYYALDGKGVFGPRKDGWYPDMFPAGLQHQPIPSEQKWRALPWLGKQTVQDPRFAKAMVGHVWYILAGRAPLRPPEDIDDPLFLSRRRAYQIQQAEIERIANKFTASNFNLKLVFKEWISSKFYRADRFSQSITDQRRQELEDIGVARLLTPEQLERKIKAIFGQKWGRLEDPESRLGILYGGIDSKEITKRNSVPSGAMGAVQRIMANEISCKYVATDFSLPPGERILFKSIEPNVIPEINDKSDQQIRKAICHLHELILGRLDEPDSPEVDLTFDLFAGIVREAKENKRLDSRESYFCQSGREVTPRDEDPHYTIRAWRAVLTYLLRQHEFLYE